MKNLLFLLMLLSANFSFSQDSSSGLQSLANVSYCKLNNESLKSVLNDFIGKQMEEDADFRTKGYVIVHVYLDIDSQLVSGKVLFKCYINKNFFSFDNISDDTNFPDYYTFMDKKPVLIYIDNLNKIIDRKFSTNSKKKFQSLMEPYVASRVETGLPGATNVFRPGEKFQIHGGIMVYIFQNEDIKPVIAQQLY